MPQHRCPPITAPTEDWLQKNQCIAENYAGLVIAVHNTKVLSSGKTGQEAEENALGRLSCPALEQIKFIQIPEKDTKDDNP